MDTDATQYEVLRPDGQCIGVYGFMSTALLAGFRSGLVCTVVQATAADDGAAKRAAVLAAFMALPVRVSA